MNAEEQGSGKESQAREVLAGELAEGRGAHGGGSGLRLRLRLSSGMCSLPLSAVEQVAPLARLEGEPDLYFLGWLRVRGERVPVFDLNRVVCEQPTPERFGSRIVLLRRAGGGRVGLLAGDVTDTVPAEDKTAPALDLRPYLPMLETLIPKGPGE